MLIVGKVETTPPRETRSPTEEGRHSDLCGVDHNDGVKEFEGL